MRVGIAILGLLLWAATGCAVPGTTTGREITGDAAPPTVGERLDVPTRRDAPLGVVGVVALSTTGIGDVWATASADPRENWAATQVWRSSPTHRGTWYRFDDVRGLAVARDGRVWIVASGGLVSFDGADWRRAPVTGLTGPLTVGRDGTVWAAAGERLVGFDGTATSEPEAPRNCADQAMATAVDGAVWAAGAGWWQPADDAGRLPACILRRAPDTGGWVRMSPPGGAAVTASLLAPDPDGGMWAWLVTPTLHVRQEGGETVLQFGRESRGLTRYDGRAWVMADAAMPAGHVTSMVAVEGALFAVVSPQPTACAPLAAGADGDRLYQVVDGAWRHIPADAGRLLAADPTGAVWVRTCAGVTYRIPSVVG